MSSVRSARCAAILSTTIVMHRIIHLTQAALEHLESIVDEPYHPNKNGVNGTSEDVESEGNGGHWFVFGSYTNGTSKSIYFTNKGSTHNLNIQYMTVWINKFRSIFIYALKPLGRTSANNVGHFWCDNWNKARCCAERDSCIQCSSRGNRYMGDYGRWLLNARVRKPFVSWTKDMSSLLFAAGVLRHPRFVAWFFSRPKLFADPTQSVVQLVLWFLWSVSVIYAHISELTDIVSIRNGNPIDILSRFSSCFILVVVQMISPILSGNLWKSH